MKIGAENKVSSSASTGKLFPLSCSAIAVVGVGVARGVVERGDGVTGSVLIRVRQDARAVVPCT